MSCNSCNNGSGIFAYGSSWWWILILIVALVLLGGKCSVKGKGFEFAEVGGRKNVFDGKPYTVYLPRHTAYTVTALTDMDFALNESPATRDTAKPTVITPEMTRTITIGRDNFFRYATIIVDEKCDS